MASNRIGLYFAVNNMPEGMPINKVAVIPESEPAGLLFPEPEPPAAGLPARELEPLSFPEPPLDRDLDLDLAEPDLNKIPLFLNDNKPCYGFTATNVI